ncbi:MAG: class A beta-lactamase-related serine hydrolase [Lachnospiraceae bacterium]|nr:class A beta-lactamase-related serine hydrolase [Lachnospiraceae bacterium]
MSDDWNRLNRQLKREEEVRRTRLHVGILVMSILLFGVGIRMIVGRVANFNQEDVTAAINESAELVGETETERETEASTEKQTEEVFAPDLTELSAQIEGMLADSSGVWSVYLKDLDTDESFTINSQSMYAASLIKLYVMMSAYENMDDLVENYCRVNRVNEIDAQATIEDRLYTMITASRNESYNELVRLHSSENSFTQGARLINSYIAENGFLSTGVHSTLHPSDSSFESTGEGINETTVEDCGALLEMIYDGTCVSEEASEEMLNLLLQQDVTTKIPAGVPDGIPVANKTGETEEETHDAAIVFGEKTDYILCVMSSEVDEMGVGNAENLIVEVSELVYEFLN